MQGLHIYRIQLLALETQANYSDFPEAQIIYQTIDHRPFYKVVMTRVLLMYLGVIYDLTE